MGGAVNGGEIYGRFPIFGLNNNQDSANNAYLPVTSVDTIGSTLGQWFGVSDANLDTVFPNLQQLPARPGLPEGGLTGRARSPRAEGAPVLDRLGEVRRGDRRARVEVGDRARDAQDAVKAARRPAQARRRALQEPRGRRRRAGNGGRAHRRRAGRWPCPGDRPRRRRAAATRAATAALAFAVGRCRRAVTAATAGTSICRSMRSSSGPLIRPW